MVFVERRKLTSRDISGSFEKLFTVPFEEFGRPPTNPPTQEVIDNLMVGVFTLDTDQAFMKLPFPNNEYAGYGGISIQVVWTNDGGTDDKNKAAKFQLGFQVAKEGDVVSGDASGSPLSVEDTYTSDSGYVEHHTDWVNIPHSTLSGKYCLFVKLMAITPTGTALTSKPRVMGVCFKYWSNIIQGAK
jgi:hypothetical protein